MTSRSCLSIILAAGEGTRMKSDLPKVLHAVAGRPLVLHVAAAALSAGGGDVALVVGRGGDRVLGAVSAIASGVEGFEQRERLGTAHAVLAAREAIARGYDDVLVMFGDTPLIDPDAISAARERLAKGADIAVMGFVAENPAGYGRLIVDAGALVAIREERDCTEEERRITLCNGGLMAIAGDKALSLLDAVGNDNAKNEFYLTDIVSIAHGLGLTVVSTEAQEESVIGINNRAELAEAEALWQKRKRHEVMMSGVTLVAPETVFFAFDTAIGADTIIEPNVVFGPGVSIEGGARIRAFCHLEGARVAAGVEVGPYARLRPGADLQQGSKVGNFCEIKNAEVGPGAKVPHLSYVGDARIAARANIGAGTITCNYDGVNKSLTEIGAGAFIGSNSSLVAPVRIGEGAYVASGSVITQDVPADALAFGRARQENREGRARQLRERQANAKKS